MQKSITHINLAKGFRGGERQTLLLIEELSKKGYSQKLVTRENSTLREKIKMLKLENLEIVSISKPYFFNLAVFKNSSLLHAHETKAAQVAFWANLFHKIPYIITRRVDNPISNNFFNKRIYGNAKCVAVLSSAIQKETLKISDKINTKIIPSAYSKLFVNDENVKNLEKRFEGKFVIGNIGELDNTHKGQYYLIEAAKRLEQSYPDMVFLFLGRGKDEANYKEQSKDMKNIIFEGFVDNVGDYIACMDLFVFPSLNEGLGSILLDIMEQKVPIIATKVGGIPDIIKNGENGILVNSKSVEEIVYSIEKIYEEKEFGKKLANVAFEGISNFSTEKMASRYEVIYGKN